MAVIDRATVKGVTWQSLLHLQQSVSHERHW